MDRDVRALFQQAFTLHQGGRLAEAEPLYCALLERSPVDLNALHLLGVLRHQSGRHAQALTLIEQAIEIDPEHAAIHLNHGATLVALGQFGRAVESYDRALALKPHYEEALANRGTALRELGRYDEAVASYDQALRLRPAYAEAWSNRGVALQGLKQFDAALESYGRALTLRPDYPEALSNRGVLLTEWGRLPEALASFDRALSVKPDYAEALYNRGNVLRELKRWSDALVSYRHALALKPGYSECLHNCAALLREMERHEEAALVYERMFALGASYPYTLGSAFNSKRQCCDWAGHAETAARIVRDVSAGPPVDTPFSLLAICDDPALQLRCAQAYTADKYPTAANPLRSAPAHAARETASPDSRIRIAYLSADFHDHATAYLMAGLFEQHDRQRFEVTAVSFGPRSPGQMRARLEKSFDRFADVQTLSDEAVARLLMEWQIDIAVDLKGFTKDARPGILALRPVPVQVSYLGYPGTMGADHIDYIVADRHVIPESQRAHYSEKVIWLPGSYQANDSARPIAERTPTRAELGLPDDAFVFCAFNSSYKITPDVFDIWMRLLRSVEGSVLWLLRGNAAVQANLMREATARGVAPDRLVFAPRMPLAEHLARHRQADLFLDNYPYNAHTTASDALWAGLPLVTYMGKAFASRVAGSLLHAIGLPELIADSLERYESLALELATDRERLAALRAKLARHRTSHPLFDTAQFRRHIESAYVEIWQRDLQGLPRDHVIVES